MRGGGKKEEKSRGPLVEGSVSLPPFRPTSPSLVQEDEAPEKCAKDFRVHLDCRLAGEREWEPEERTGGKHGVHTYASAVEYRVEYRICTYHIQGLLHEAAMNPQLLFSLG